MFIYDVDDEEEVETYEALDTIPEEEKLAVIEAMKTRTMISKESRDAVIISASTPKSKTRAHKSISA